MIVKNAEFVISAVGPKQYPDDYLPEIALAGRSNVGKSSLSVKEKWGHFIEAYLVERENLCGVIQLVDLRHPPSKDDIAMYDWLMQLHKEVLVVATKCDKVSKGQWQKHIKQVREGLKADKSQQIVVFSAENGQGLEELHAWVEKHIAGETFALEKNSGD